MSGTPEWLSIKAAARRLGINPVTLRKWRERGMGPPWYKIGVYPRYKRNDVDEYIQNASGNSDPQK